MIRGTFYCYHLPTVGLDSIDWLIETPTRDWELEADVGQPVWIVQYNSQHPKMQKNNRFNTCQACGFSDIVFEDEIGYDFENEIQQITLIIGS